MIASNNGTNGSRSQNRDGLMGREGNPQDEEAPTESSPLVPNSELLSPTGSESSEGAQRLWEEVAQPWPATYERSIALLASPIISPKQVELFTHSPKPGASPMALAQLRRRMNESPRPQGQLLPPAKEFRMGMERVQSLDFAKKKSSTRPNQQQKLQATTLTTLEDEQRKAQEAKAYRQKLLQQQTEATPVKDQKGKGGGKTTFSQCVFNMSNILMGVGLLGLPFVFKSAGWDGGLFACVLFAFITWKTSILIARELNGDPRPVHIFEDKQAAGATPFIRMRRQIRSFPDIARDAFGEVGCIMLSLVLYFELFSCLCIFLVTLGDHLHYLFPSVSITHHMMTAAAVSTIPTIVLHTPRLLSYLSMVGTFATVSVVSAVVLSAVLEGDMTDKAAKTKELTNSEESHHILWRTPGLPLAFGMIAYCFSGHALVPSIYSSMERPQDFDRMISFTYLIVAFCCLAVSISGYYMFGYVVEDQITLSLAENSSAVQMMKLLTWLMILTAFSKLSLTVFPLALGMEEIVASYLSTETGMLVVSSIIKLVLTFAALCVAIFVPSFSILCALVGLICTLAVSVIFPAAAHLKLFGPKLTLAEKCLDWLFVVFGSFVAVIGTIATLST